MIDTKILFLSCPKKYLVSIFMKKRSWGFLFLTEINYSLSPPPIFDSLFLKKFSTISIVFQLFFPMILEKQVQLHLTTSFIFTYVHHGQLALYARQVSKEVGRNWILKTKSLLKDVGELAFWMNPPINFFPKWIKNLYLIFYANPNLQLKQCLFVWLSLPVVVSQSYNWKSVNFYFSPASVPENVLSLVLFRCTLGGMTVVPEKMIMHVFQSENRTGRAYAREWGTQS